MWYPGKQVIMGMRAGETSEIPRQASHHGYGGGKISVIPRQASHRGYESRKISLIPRQVDQQESREGVNTAKKMRQKEVSEKAKINNKITEFSEKRVAIFLSHCYNNSI